MIDYAKRLVEVDEILNYLPIDEYNKIPVDVINIIENKKDKNYTWKFDESKKLKEQDVPNDTIAILSYLNMEYILNDEQKDFLNKVHRLNDIKSDSDYIDSRAIFEQNKVNNSDNKNNANTSADMIKPKENIFTKIINTIKNIFFSK